MAGGKVYRRTVKVDGKLIRYTYDTRNRLVHVPGLCENFIEECCWDCAPKTIRDIVAALNIIKEVQK